MIYVLLTNPNFILNRLNVHQIYQSLQRDVWEVFEHENLTEFERSEILSEFGFPLHNEENSIHVSQLCQDLALFGLWQVASIDMRLEIFDLRYTKFFRSEIAYRISPI